MEPQSSPSDQRVSLQFPEQLDPAALVGKLQAQISSMAAQNTSLAAHNTSLTAQNTSLSTQITSLAEKNSSLAEQIASLAARLERLEASEPSSMPRPAETGGGVAAALDHDVSVSHPEHAKDEPDAMSIGASERDIRTQCFETPLRC